MFQLAVHMSLRVVGLVVPSVYHTRYYTTLLGQHRRECQLTRD